MRSSILILLLVATSAAAVAHGGEAEVGFQSWDGESELSGGWTQTKLKTSSTHSNGAQFSGADYTLTSPRFTGTVQTVSVRLTCSRKNPARILKLIPILPNGKEGVPQDFDEPETVDSYEWQVKDIELCGVDQFKIGVSSGNTGYWYVLSVKVTYDETSPIDHPVEPEPVVEHISLTNRWKVSEFAKVKGGLWVREADFSPLIPIVQQTDWTNGETLDSIYAFTGVAAFDCIRQARSTAYMCGLYAIQTNGIGGLGVLGTGGGDAFFLLPIELDVKQKVRGITLDYRCWQPRVGTENTTLSFSWCATDSLDEIERAGWVSATEGDYSGGGDGPVKKVEITGRGFKDAKFLCFKWSVPKQPNSSLLGVSDLHVTADLGQPGFALHIR